MSVSDLMKLLAAYNKNYIVKMVVVYGNPEIVIVDFNDRVIKELPL